MPDWLHGNRIWLFGGVAGPVVIAIIAVIRWLIRRESRTDKAAEAELEIQGEGGQPQFSWTHAVKDPRVGITRQFRNEGGKVSILLVKTAAPVRVEWHPKGSLSSHDGGWVRFTSNGNEVPLPITFEIHYHAASGQAGKQVFHLTTAVGQPERLE
jgi:hypothetical protein